MTDDCYIRLLRVPAGTLIFGRVHITGHLLMLDYGEDLTFGPDGIVHRVAPWKTHTKPGFQMVRYAITDTVSRAILPNPEHLTREELEKRHVEDESLQIEKATAIYNKHNVLTFTHENNEECHSSQPQSSLVVQQ
jgi:hypothetical protein